MRARFLVLALSACGLAAENHPASEAPSYSEASVVNSATNTADALAPNTIATIYGTELSYEMKAAGVVGAGAMMSPVLAGVHVYVGGIEAPLYYVSPKQINFIIPSELRLGDWDLFVAREGTSGPHVLIKLREAGPGFYEWEPGMIASTDAKGGIITKEHPAKAGDIVVLYGTGLGRTRPEAVTGMVSMVPAKIQLLNELQVLVNGKPVDAKNVQYAGVTPGTPGLYQVNLKLPKPLAANPEIRIVIGGKSSPADMRLPLR